MRKLLVIIFLILTAFVHVLSLEKSTDAMKQLPQGEEDTFVLPAPILKIASLEYQGLASDVLFLKAMLFIGETQQRKETPSVKDWEWKWWAKVLDTATDLDPYFYDPYYYANAFLPWDAHMTEETNRLLKKGSRYRDWDWTLPFYIGFNDFFFLQKDAEASAFLMEASRRPGGDPMYASIAARLAFKENRIETAIFFLEQTANTTDDINVKRRFETRISALRSIVVLEKAMSLYEKKFNRMPSNVDELVSGNILKQLPLDPYGGTYYIAKDGKVRSTKSSELEPYLSPAKKFQR